MPALLATMKTPGKTTILEPRWTSSIATRSGTLLLLEQAAVLETANKIKFVYTPLHGTGIRAIPALLDQFGFKYSIVPEQAVGDGRFPTVKSPNPENAEALELAIKQAEKENADIVLATDPDADRMGVAVRDASGKMILLTGNMIGSIMAYYRTSRMIAQGIITDSNKKNAVIIKTFVTTDLQKAIAEHFGVGCIDTLTGFKYIGEKMHDYEKAHGPEFAKMSGAQKRAATLTAQQVCDFRRRGKLRLHRRRLRARQGRERGGADVRGSRGVGEVAGARRWLSTSTIFIARWAIIPRSSAR